MGKNSKTVPAHKIAKSDRRSCPAARALGP
jgi:hypothetical protein